MEVKRFLACLAFIVCALLATCCAPRARETPPPLISAPEPMRSFSTVLHVDQDFTPEARERIQQAASAWERMTHGRVAYHIRFDLDFADEDSLAEHVARKHNLVIGVLEDFEIVAKIDEQFLGSHPLAVTVGLKDGSIRVFLIMDRIEQDHFTEVAVHEFGHVAGFPDLPMTGAVMSGTSLRGSTPLEGFTPTDVELCRGMRYCD